MVDCLLFAVMWQGVAGLLEGAGNGLRESLIDLLRDTQWQAAGVAETNPIHADVKTNTERYHERRVWIAAAILPLAPCIWPDTNGVTNNFG